MSDINYLDDLLFNDEFKIHLDPREDVMLTNAGNWSDSQVDNYKANKRKENDVHVIIYIRKERHAKELQKKYLQSLKRKFIMGVIGAVGTGIGGWICLSFL